MWLYEDLGFQQRLFCSLQVLADLIFPFHAEGVRFCHDHDGRCWLSPRWPQE